MCLKHLRFSNYLKVIMEPVLSNLYYVLYDHLVIPMSMRAIIDQ